MKDLLLECLSIKNSKMLKTKFIIFKSEKAQNPFAPEWEYIITEQTVNKINYKDLSKFLLKLEKELIKKIKPSNDGYTGLGNKSITSRYKYFNLLNFKNKELTKLKKYIIEAHNNLLNNYKIPLPKNLWIQCWFNVLRKGEKINPHIHGTSPDSYLGGHLMVQCQETKTVYINPQNQINEPIVYNSNNEEGKLTLFQTCIPHYTDEQVNKKERISIAFDLSLKQNNNNFIKL